MLTALALVVSISAGDFVEDVDDDFTRQDQIACAQGAITGVLFAGLVLSVGMTTIYAVQRYDAQRGE